MHNAMLAFLHIVNTILLLSQSNWRFNRICQVAPI